MTSDTPNILEDVDTQLCDIEAVFTPGDASAFGFHLRAGDDGEKVTVAYNTQAQRISVDRSQSGRPDISGGVHEMALIPMENGQVKLRVLVDTSIIDVFGNDGEFSTNCFYYNDPASTDMEFFAVDGNVTIDPMNIYSMKSTWREMDRPGGPPAPPVAPDPDEVTVSIPGTDFDPA